MVYFYWFIFFFLLVNIRAINRSVGGFTLNAVLRFFGVQNQPVPAPVNDRWNCAVCSCPHAKCVCPAPKTVAVFKTKAQIEQSAYDRIEAMYKDMKK